jgi:acyl carrier protein
MPDHDSIKAQIRRYLLDNLLFSENDADLPDDASLLDRGILDSTGVLEVVLFLEERFGIQVKDTEMLPENFDSVNNLVRFVERSGTA